MLTFIDTHAHLYVKAFDSDREAIMKRASDAGIRTILLPNIDEESIEAMMDVVKRFPQCIPMMGLHPCSVTEKVHEQLKLIREWLQRENFCAVGEIGVDLYWDKTTLGVQEIAFKEQMRWAQQLGLPVAIHCRDAFEAIFRFIEELEQEEEFKGKQFNGVFHCFTGNLEQAQQLIDKGFYLGIGGVVTYKNGGLDQVLPHLSLKHLVLETDAPYLSPLPYRGKRNESSYIRIIAMRLAELMNCGLDEVSRATNENAHQLFNLKKHEPAA
jgi:TatD DNase family protein